MKTLLVAASAALFLAAPISAIAGGPGEAPGQRDDNWGEVTSGAIAEGFDQGNHASDPSGDGRGPGLNEGKRSGLANVDERGSLSSTMDLLGF